jgi:hypothetical protein
MLAKQLQIAIVASADRGDISSVVRYSDSLVSISQELLKEPDVVRLIQAVSVRKLIMQSLGESVLQNPDNRALLNAAAQIIQEMPALPNYREVAAGQFRTDRGWLFDYLDIEPKLIQRFLLEFARVPNDLAWVEAANRGDEVDPRSRDVLMGVLDAYRDYVTSFGQREIYHSMRRTGPSTAKAYEARTLQYYTWLIQRLNRIESVDSQVFEEIEDASQSLWRKDPSYELMLIGTILAEFVEYCLRDAFGREATLQAFAIIGKGTSEADLAGVGPGDPYKSELPGVLTATATGFKIYSIGEDKLDGGFPPRPGFASSYFTISRGDGVDDYGVSVNFAPVAPVP